MIERSFELETSPDIERFWLHCNYNEQKHIVTMADVEEAFKDNPLELTRIQNNKSSTWFLEKIY
ncbi:hypothetical protein PHYNN_119 [Pantoea phage Phynn]|nr:hypothetical protein PHYNN_119 [Pantoea phage Phynn]